MSKYIWTAFGGAFVVLLWTAQTAPDRPKISSPVRHNISLAGTFGELRPDHFHTGMDIKSTQGAVGDSVFAVDNGFVHRIVVSSVGFGYGLYLVHPHGYTSVYGHLLKFRDDLADYAYQHQVKVKSWAINAYPGPEKFKVKKGDFIGFMGNSGSSHGPHLHFEIRRTSDSRLFDPWSFGVSYEDQVKPYIKSLTIYRRGQNLPVLSHPVFGDLAEDTLLLPSGAYALGIEAFDQMNGSSNRNGVQKIEVTQAGKQVFLLNLSSLFFSDNRYTNAILDYRLRRTKDRYVYQLFHLPGNKFNGSKAVNQGFVDVPADGRLVKIQIKVNDAHGNTRLLNVNLQSKGSAISPIKVLTNTQRMIRPEERFRYNTDYFQVDIPPQALYDQTPWSLMVHEEQGPGIFSTVYQVLDSYTPLADPFTIRIKPRHYHPTLQDKLFIARCDEHGEMTYEGGEWQDGFLRTRTGEFGTFQVMVDTISPIIQVVRFPLQWSGVPGVSFIITDNINGNKLIYQAYLGTTWIPMAFDAKNDLLFFDHKISFPSGEHEFRLVVEDGRKNKAEYKRKITIL